MIMDIQVYPEFRDYRLSWDKRVLLVKKVMLVFLQDPPVMAVLLDC